MDITFLTRRWRRKLKQNDILQLSLHGKQSSKRHRRSSTKNSPLVLIFAQDDSFLTKRLHKSLKFIKTEHKNKLARRKRTSRRRRNKWKRIIKKRRHCKSYDFEVDFEKIGWGPWIVYPKRFNAKLCYGLCPDPLGHEHNPSNHAVMQSLMRLQLDEEIPRTCCVPTKLLPLSMLYYDKNQIVLRHHEDLIVGECGCR